MHLKNKKNVSASGTAAGGRRAIHTPLAAPITNTQRK